MSTVAFQYSVFLPSIFYALLLLWVTLPSQQGGGRSHVAFWLQAVVLFDLVLHGFVLHNSVFMASGFIFGFAQDLSLIAWVGLAFYWFQSWFLPISGLRWLVMAFAMICALLPALFPGEIISAHAVADPWFKVHFIVATIAVGLLSLAAMHAMLMSIQDRALHRQLVIIPDSRIANWLEELPPLMTMETMLFNLLYVGFGLLTMTVFSGLLFSQTLFGRPLVFDHKTIFALASWALFGSLLLARIRIGLRGRAAVRWVLSAYCVLLLAYVGSRFVLEVILQKA